EDIDAHCARARKAGAEILMEPETQFYGDRTYRARDPEGHIWTFGQTVKQVSPEEWDKESGFSTKMYE
ncbi:MAG TPA: VOC family protein, partial [Parvularculaceae bacterium]|nr:VOC family protein [Parvularculaceae bacterium]